MNRKAAVAKHVVRFPNFQLPRASEAGNLTTKHAVVGPTTTNLSIEVLHYLFRLILLNPTPGFGRLKNWKPYPLLASLL